MYFASTGAPQRPAGDAVLGSNTGSLAPGFVGANSPGAIPPSPEHCPLADIHCDAARQRVRPLMFPQLGIVAFLLFAFLVDLLRARLRLRQQLYMPLRHIQVLLTVEVRPSA